MKKLLTVLLIVLGVIFVLLLTKDFIIKASVEKGVELVTGLRIRIGSLSVGIFKPVAHIKNFRLLNPSDFPDKTMIDIPEIYVNYDLPAIIKGKIHLPEVRFALKEMTVVKNSKGELNLDSLKSIQAQKKSEPAGAKGPAKLPDIKIDLFKLNIGKVVFKDYSKGSEPSVKEFNINLDETYTNIDNPYTLANLIVVKALMKTSIAALTNFDLKGLQGAVGGALSGAKEVVSTAADKAQKAAKQATDTLKDVLKNPFGSKE
ncbi:MAG: hypothetical protein KJ880_07885 [Candidatus Omnitrophica bacterium]|nr:hypothetical protein [Candidatus Omnitrophota bacterium]